MFPTLSYLIEYLTGVFVPLPIHTFGLMVALAFAAAYWAFTQELKRKEKLGLIHPFKKKIAVGKPASATELTLNGIFGFFIGYKILFAVLNYSTFVNDPQGILLSSEGNFLGGIILAAIFVYWSYRDKEKTKLAKPKIEEITVHPYQLMSTIVVWAAIAGFLGAKVFHNLEYWDEFVQHPIDSLLSFSGLTFYGGLICGGAAVLYIAHKHGIKIVHMLDIGAPGMMLSYAVGRIGCHLAGDGDWGIVNTSPKPGWLSWAPDWVWAFNYPHNVVNEGVPIAGCTGKYCSQLLPPVFPTPFYEIIACFILFFILWSLRHRINIPGLLFSIYLIFNGLERFFIEKIRINSHYHAFGLSFTQAEMISFILVLGGIIGAIAFTMSYKKSRSKTNQVS